MADIELVVKIPEELYIAYKGRPPMLGDAGMDMIAQSIANGTPLDEFLDKVRAEIEQLHYHPKLDFIRNDDVVEMALAIIDKYKESEVNNG